MKNTKFKVGDRVTVMQSSINTLIGKDGTLTGVNNDNDIHTVKLDNTRFIHIHGKRLRYSREQQVLEILRNYDKIRSSKGQGTTQVDS